MKFSVIIPVYNAEKHLETAVDNVLKQTVESLEIILVDDGSTDGTKVICDGYATKFPDTIKVVHQANSGQLVSRCRGIQVATGDYCLFMDADDLLVDGIFDVFTDLLNKYRNPDLLIYSFMYEYEDGSRKEAVKLADDEKVFAGDGMQSLYELLFFGTVLNNVWTKLVRTDVLRKCDFEEDKYAVLRCAEDRLQSMEIVAKATNAVYTTKALYRYRLVSGSMTRDYSPERIGRFNTVMMYEKTVEYMRNWNMYCSPWREMMEAGWFGTALHVFDRFYENVRTMSQRRQVLDYDWSLFIPEDLQHAYMENPCLNDIRKRLWDDLVSKRICRVRLYMWKRDIRRKFVKTVRACLGN